MWISEKNYIYSASREQQKAAANRVTHYGGLVCGRIEPKIVYSKLDYHFLLLQTLFVINVHHEGSFAVANRADIATVV